MDLREQPRCCFFTSIFCLRLSWRPQDWVKTYVPEQLFPVNKRISDTEANVTQLGGQVQTMSKQIADIDSRLNQTTAKADQALENLQRLKLDRKLVLDLRQGAFFPPIQPFLPTNLKKR